MRPRALVGALACCAALALPGVAHGARYHLGLAPGADPVRVADQVRAATGVEPDNLAPLHALAVDAPRSALDGIAGVSWIERARTRRLAFAPSDPLAARQWYAVANRSYDAWEVPPPLAPVRVAVIDSGIDLAHPELQRRIASAKSFVGGTAQDARGHGTIVAGIIAAELDNATGIAGLAPGAELLVAKVVSPGGTIAVEAEAKAIRWAVDNGARVINISLGGLRDPRRPSRDTYSRLEEEAVRYAVQRGAVVIAAVGNADQAPRSPWPFASYPAALPHVLGVSALTRSGSSPTFSNRDAVYNDVAAPGEDILSTFPRALTADRPGCVEQGYTPCATEEFRPPDGTSFAAPQVTAIAANLLGVRPLLRPEQVTTLIERTAVDASAATGCRACALGRDALTGWGAVDGAAAVHALSGVVPSRDAHEPNDNAGEDAYRLYFTPGEKARFVKASVDFWDDQDDVFAVYLRRGERLFVSLVPAVPSTVVLVLWRPGTASVSGLAPPERRLRFSDRAGRRERLAWKAVQEGWYYLQARLAAPSHPPVAYRLSLVRTR
ncbi:MAG TPA: S8 family serine peptidase [Gaiella sp.]|nr:S8 family serine peptidase [Gaiella sp.]